MNEILKKYFNKKDKLPEYLLSWGARENVKYFGLTKARVIANYIATLTDLYATKEFNRLFRKEL